MTRHISWSKQQVVEAIRLRQQQGLPIATIYRDDVNLYAAAKRYWRTWNRALRAAGFSPNRRRWSSSAVIHAIHDRARRGLPLRGVAREDYRLTNAASHYFGSWRKALGAAGQPAVLRQQWTPERVIAAIQAHHREGQPIGRIYRDNPNLYSAGGRYFGKWAEALRAAGFSPPVRRKWSREIVLRELRARYRPGVSRTCFWAENSQLAGAAKRYVGGKRRALICAGLSREDPRPLRKWSREDVIDAIQAWYRQGRSLKHLGREDPGLYASAKRWFGRWSDAVRAAGLDPNIPRHWSPDDVLDAIRSRHQAGLPMTGVYHASPSLFAAAKKRFGSWHRAMLAAGLDSIQRKQWTNSIVLAAIRNHHARGTLSRVWREDPSLLNAGCKRFGSWQNALAAAGLQPRRLQRWSTERILRELRPWNGQTQHAVRLADPRLADAAARYFGSLQKAAEAAGIELRQRKWPPERIIEAIQNRYVRGLTLLPCQDRRLFGAAIRVFGSWRAAVATAGLVHKLPQPKNRPMGPLRTHAILPMSSRDTSDVA